VDGRDDLLKVVGLSDDFDGFRIADETVEGGLVGRSDDEGQVLDRGRAADEPQKAPIRITGWGDVVDEHGGCVPLDELDQIDPALLMSGMWHITVRKPAASSASRKSAIVSLLALKTAMTGVPSTGMSDRAVSAMDCSISIQARSDFRFLGVPRKAAQA
jgi:hypothetical protein